jgi:hypothetical protein
MLAEQVVSETISPTGRMPEESRPIANGWSRMVEAAQKVTHFRIAGQAFRRIPFGGAPWDEQASETCHTCEASKGQLHVPTCDIEQCPGCGGHVVSCTCGLMRVPARYEDVRAA